MVKQNKMRVEPTLSEAIEVTDTSTLHPANAPDNPVAVPGHNSEAAERAAEIFKAADSLSDLPGFDTVKEEKARNLFTRSYADKAILLAEISKHGHKLIETSGQLEGPLFHRLAYLSANLIDFEANPPGAEPRPVLIEMAGVKRLRVEYKTIKDAVKEAIGYTQAKKTTLAGTLATASSGSLRSLDTIVPLAVKAAFLAHAKVNGAAFLSVNPKTGVGVPEGSEVKGGFMALCMPWNSFEPGIHVSGAKVAMNNTDTRMLRVPNWAIAAQYAKTFEGAALSETGRVKRDSDGSGSAKDVASSLAKEAADMDTDTRVKVLVAAAMILRDGDSRATMRNHPTAKDAIANLLEVIETVCNADGTMVPAKTLDAAIAGEAGWTAENAAE